MFLRVLRAVLLTGAGLALMESYARHGIVGAGDAQWYATAVGDFVAQIRAGVFPVWVGQTRFSFYGGIFPLRVAPLLEHAAALVDLATGRRLPEFRVLNLTLTALLVGGIWSCHLCLRRIAPGRPWACAWLAILYGSCPGVLGLAYAQDLYMSFATLPFAPVAFLGMIRAWETDRLQARLLLAGGLAATFLAHPPIALWCGLVALAFWTDRVVDRGWNRRLARLDLATLGTFVVLAAYPIASELSLHREGAAPVDLRDLLAVVRDSFPGNWLPLPRPVLLENLQLGYGLAAVLLSAAALALLRRTRPALLFLGPAVLLLAALIPVPGLTSLGWHLLPQALVNLTNEWPMQRLLVVLALCIVFGAAPLLQRSGTRTGRWISSGGLALLMLWSGWQASRLIIATDRRTPTVQASTVMQRSENLPITNLYVWTGTRKARAPRYASAGVMDPELEQRLLDRNTQQLLESPIDRIAPGFGPAAKTRDLAALPGTFDGKPDANPGILNLEPALTLEPGRRYLLLLGFLDRPNAGTLFLQGPDFERQYALPLSGESRAFGSGRDSARAIPLWTSADHPVQIRLRFAPAGGAPATRLYHPFARFELRPYDSADLPVQLSALVPSYRARVRIDRDAYLETPRLLIAGYSATVDGRPTPVAASPDGYVMVPVNASSREVEVRYLAPLAVRSAYWLSGLAWILWLWLQLRSGDERLAPPLRPV